MEAVDRHMHAGIVCHDVRDANSNFRFDCEPLLLLFLDTRTGECWVIGAFSSRRDILLDNEAISEQPFTIQYSPWMDITSAGSRMLRTI